MKYQGKPISKIVLQDGSEVEIENAELETFAKPKISQYDIDFKGWMRNSESKPLSFDLTNKTDNVIRGIDLFNISNDDLKNVDIEYFRGSINDTYSDFKNMIDRVGNFSFGIKVGITHISSTSPNQTFKKFEIVNGDEAEMMTPIMDPMQNQPSCIVLSHQFDLNSDTKFLIQELLPGETVTYTMYPMSMPFGLSLI